jgi:hypothetical protein
LGLGYCIVANVKAVLKLSVEDESLDVEVAAAIVSGDALVDSLLKPYDLSVSVVVPQNIVDAAAHFAAWIVRRHADPAGAEVFWVEANRFLEAYVDSESEPAFVVEI